MSLGWIITLSAQLTGALLDPGVSPTLTLGTYLKMTALVKVKEFDENFSGNILDL